ncbi:hypothetical protein CCACVL1_13727, partial [Corchorus capsularis]
AEVKIVREKPAGESDNRSSGKKSTNPSSWPLNVFSSDTIFLTGREE